ncbi:dihydrofolate reductase family protein [Candidatus Kaiserbacteria bacterium]|nr:dihydrofolate reductase family protein [Candidatus Kaiserbacteria bacterium]
MKIILAYVTSLDGMITDAKGRSPVDWASREDQTNFRKLIKASEVVIIGTNTYLAHRDPIRASKSPRRIVMTSEPERFMFDTKPGLLEFTDAPPRAIVTSLKKQGVRKVLLASGPKLTNEFLRQKLVDELHLTVEPAFFGSGTLAAPASTSLKLMSVKKLNSKGTLLIKYRILR